MKKYINLNPKILNKTIIKENINNTLKKVSILILGLSVILYITLMVNNVIYVKKIDKINKQLSSEKEFIEENNILNKNIMEKEKFLEKINTLKEEKNDNSKLLSNINQFIPTEIKFTNFVIVNKEINISGESIDYNSINEMLANLQTSENYSKAHLTSVTHDKLAKTYVFNIVIKE